MQSRILFFLNDCHDDGVFSEYGAPEEGELKKWEAVPLTKELISQSRPILPSAL